MERATEIFAAVYMTAIGVSHVAQPRVWIDFFVWLRGKGEAGVFVNGLLSLSFGAFIVAFHNVWDGLAVILTLIGWGQVLKGLVSLVVPKVGMWGLARVSYERQWEFTVGGAFLLGLCAVLWYIVFTH